MAKARRFFVEDISPDAESVEVRGEEMRHLKKVLRLLEGSPVLLFNGKGLELSGVIEGVGKDAVKVLVTGTAEMTGESDISVTLLQALIKGDKPEFTTQKATELGVQRIVFYTNERTVPKPSADKIEKRLERLRRISIEAVKQCERSVVPEILLVGFDAALGLRATDNGVILYEGETKRSLKDVLSSFTGDKGVSVLIGPEGGFTEEEVEKAVASGFQKAGLGRRILRSETASLSALAIVQYELGDMG